MNPTYLEVTDNNNFDSIKPIPIQIYVSTINLGTKTDPYSMFRFPKLDPPLTKAGQLEVSKLDSLEYIINLTAGKLRPDLKLVWDQLAGRDTALKEISKSGMQLISYDLKQECAKFKITQQTQRYLNDLNKLSAFNCKISKITCKGKDSFIILFKVSREKSFQYTKMYTNTNCNKCPQKFSTCGNTKKMYNALIGARASLISFNCLKDFGFSSHDIEFSTELIKDAILGIIAIRKHRLFENSREFGSTKITFLLTAPEVKLSRTILGVPWMKAAGTVATGTEIRLAENKVRARLVHSNNTESKSSLQLKMEKNLKLESKKRIDGSTQYTRFQMNAFFISNSLKFTMQPRKGIKLPEVIIMQNAMNINRLKLPIKIKKEFKTLTINVTLMEEPTCQEAACEEVEPNLQEPGTTTEEGIDPGKIEQSIKEPATFISLPESIRKSFINDDSHITPVQIDDGVQPEKTMNNEKNVKLEKLQIRSKDTIKGIRGIKKL